MLYGFFASLNMKWAGDASTSRPAVQTCVGGPDMKKRIYPKRPSQLSDHLCECGCGGYTNKDRCGDKRYGRLPGDPFRYIRHHQPRGGPPSTPLVERFWAKVRKGEGCWEWTAYRDTFGYGHVCVGSRTDKTIRMVPAHRVSWELTYGPIPPQLHALHRCDNPSCVRPDHLFLGTIADNNRDAAKKGRSTRGERSHSARLTWLMVRTLRDDAAAGTPTPELGRKYGITRDHARRIVRNLNWKELP